MLVFRGGYTLYHDVFVSDPMVITPKNEGYGFPWLFLGLVIIGTCAILLVRNHHILCNLESLEQYKTDAGWSSPPKKKPPFWWIHSQIFTWWYIYIYIWIYIYIFNMCIYLYGIHICRYLQDEIFFDFHMYISKNKYIYIYIYTYIILSMCIP